MKPLLIIFSIFSNPIGRAVPTDVVCRDAATKHSVGAGSFLDAQESLAVVQLAEAYERGCADKVVALAEHRDEQQTEAVAATATASAAAGAFSGAGLLAFLKRRKSK